MLRGREVTRGQLALLLLSIALYVSAWLVPGRSAILVRLVAWGLLMALTLWRALRPGAGRS